MSFMAARKRAGSTDSLLIDMGWTMPTDDLRRTLAAYPVHCPITIRVSDMDGYGHLNAIRLGQYYEDARAASYGVILKDVAFPRMPIAQLTIRYLAEGFWPGTLVVGTGIERVGTTSFTMVQGLFSEGRCIGLADTVLVCTADGGPVPVAPAMRQALERAALGRVCEQA